MGIEAAIIGSAILGAGTSLASGAMASDSMSEQSDAALQAQREALAQQERLSAPYRALGEGAIPRLQDLLGLGGGGTAGILSSLQQMPGYQFAQQQGSEATKRQAQAMGLGMSGNTLQALSQFNQNLATGTYQNAVSNLFDATRLGQAASANQAAAASNYGANAANLAMNQGNMQAGIMANTLGGVGRAIGGGLENYMTYNTLQGLRSAGGGGIGMSPSYYGQLQNYGVF